MLSLGLYISRKSWGYYSGELLINAVYGGVMGGAGIGLALVRVGDDRRDGIDWRVFCITYLNTFLYRHICL